MRERTTTSPNRSRCRSCWRACAHWRVVDLAARRARRGGRAIELTAKEFALLECFALHPDEVLDRAMITAHVWDDNHDPFTNVLEVLVRRLRRKLDDDFEPKLIHTMRGAGYRLGV